MTTEAELRKIVKDEIRSNNNWIKQQVVGSHNVTRGVIRDELADPEALAAALAPKLSGAGSSVTPQMIADAFKLLVADGD